MTNNIADLNYFVVQRSIDNINFDSIALVDAPINPFAIMSYTDNDVETNLRSYYYRIVPVDICGARTLTNIGRTIFLQVESRFDFVNDLDWNAYEGWGAGIFKYKVKRSFNNNWDEIQTFYFKNYSYDDDVSNENSLDGTFCYQIEAAENYNTLPAQWLSDAVTSSSNIVCVTQYPSIYVPNAFSPKGLNKIFKPVMLFADGSTYNMVIYNRWGHKVFETTNVDIGWDGKFNGKLAPQGIYVYIIQFTNPDGNTYRKQGPVFLWRIQ